VAIASLQDTVSESDFLWENAILWLMNWS